MSTETMYRHDLLLGPDEHFALGSALANTLMSFYDTSHKRGLTDMEERDFKATKKLYDTITGSSSVRLLKTYKEVLANPYTGDGCPF